MCSVFVKERRNPSPSSSRHVAAAAVERDGVHAFGYGWGGVFVRHHRVDAELPVVCSFAVGPGLLAPVGAVEPLHDAQLREQFAQQC